MSAILRQTAQLLWTQSWQLALAGLIVIGLVWCIRRRSPHLAYVLCLVLLIKCIAPPTVSVPWGLFSQTLPVLTPTIKTPPTGSYEFEPLTPTAALTNARLEPTDVPEAMPPASPRRWTPTGVDGIVLTWLIGASWLGLCWLASEISMRRRLRSATVATEESIERLFRQLRREMGVSDRVRLLQTSLRMSPGSFGWLRPTVVLPTFLLAGTSEEELRLILTHELMHFKRRDHWHALLQRVVEVIGWFHPVVWWASKQTNRERERCCDADLLQVIDQPADRYAECLLAVANQLRGQPAGLAMSFTMGSDRVRGLRERMEGIMSAPLRMKRASRWHGVTLLLLGSLIWPGAAWTRRLTGADQPAPINQPTLKSIKTLDPGKLSAPSAVEVVADGKFFLAAAWNNATIGVYRRDEASGAPLSVHHVTDQEQLDGCVRFALHPQGDMVAVTSFRSKTITLFDIQPHSGRLHVVDRVTSSGAGNGPAFSFSIEPPDAAAMVKVTPRQPQSGAMVVTPADAFQRWVFGMEAIQLASTKKPAAGDIPLNWVIAVSWSPDGKNLYVGDAHGEGRSGSGRILVYQLINHERLKQVQVLEAPDGEFDNIRGVTCHPDGKTLIVTSAQAGTLAVLNRDPTTGQVSFRQIITHDDNTRCLEGVMTNILSADGQHLYTISGRFNGVHAVGVFKFDPKGKAHLVQQLLSNEGGLPAIEGGNNLALSHDGKTLYASFTNSGHLLGLQRDPNTGRLTLSEIYTAQTPIAVPAGVNGLAVSPDDRWLYICSEDANTVSIMERIGANAAPGRSETPTLR